jgi:hypothetical protein
MAKRKPTKQTPEVQAEYDKRTQEIWARIAERKAREQEQAQKSA